MDTIADFLTILRNGTLAKKESVSASHSRIKEEIARVVKDAGFIEDYAVSGEAPHKNLDVTLRYFDKNTPAISGIKRISKPSVRIYAKSSEIPFTMSGAGLTIISTPKGIMSGHEARKQHLGGEVICQIW